MFRFSIRSSTVRLGIFISSLVIAVIIIFQLVWLRKVYRLEQKTFDHSVVAAIRGLYEDLDIAVYNTSPLNKLIENPQPDLYRARINLPVNIDSLLAYFQYELEYFNIFTDCHISIYRADSNRLIYERSFSATKINTLPDNKMAVVTKPFDYLSLYFPKRRQYILSQMDVWVTASVILLVVLLLFGISIYFFYRQKFLNETQKDFIHNFTHEFKTPVAVISLAADVLKEPSITGKPDKLVTYANIVAYQSSYLEQQIGKLLRFANADSRSLQLNKEKVNLHILIQEAIKNLNPLIQEKKATIDLELEASDPMLVADKDYLVILLFNLVDNALKYARTPQVVIRTESGSGRIQVQVEDNGIGMNKKDLKQIFRQFFRARQGETYAAKGFGLGLSFVKKIVDAHHGKINVASEPGKGSVFTIVLPVS